MATAVEDVQPGVGHLAQRGMGMERRDHSVLLSPDDEDRHRQRHQSPPVGPPPQQPQRANVGVEGPGQSLGVAGEGVFPRSGRGSRERCRVGEGAMDAFGFKTADAARPARINKMQDLDALATCFSDNSTPHGHASGF